MPRFDSYRERAARVSTGVALVFFALLVPYNLARGSTAISVIDGLAAVLLLLHLLLLRRLDKPIVSAVVALAVLAALVVPLGVHGYVQAYFWADAAPPLIFFFAGTRRGAWLAGGLFAAIIVLLITVPPREVASGVDLGIVISFLSIVIFAFVNERQRLRYEAELLRLGETDELTDIANRRRFHELLEVEHERSTRYQRTYAVMVIDADRFKEINDRFGHGAGDEVLKVLAASLVQSVRTTDFVARFGGDEFAVLCPETTLQDAAALADRLRVAVLAEAPGATHGVTLTIGVAALRPGDAPPSVLKRADEALYAAKAGGRNRVQAAG